MTKLSDEERTALDPVGAEVYPVARGVLQVGCQSHATFLSGPERARAYLERRAATHNRNWHPNLTPKESTA